MCHHRTSNTIVVSQCQQNNMPIVDGKSKQVLLAHDESSVANVKERRIKGDVFASNVTSSSISLYDPYAKALSCSYDLLSPTKHNASITCVGTASFASRTGEELVLAGVAVDLNLQSQSNKLQCSESFIYAFSVQRQSDGSTSLSFVHKTSVGKRLVSCIQGYQDHVLVGVDNLIRLYDCGSNQLLLKSECKDLPRNAVRMCVMGKRFVVGDAINGVHWGHYDQRKSMLRIFADEVVDRRVTCMYVLDYNTVAVGDKFGTVSILRIPDSVNEELRADAGSEELWSKRLFAAPWKCQEVSRFYLGETIISIKLTSLLGQQRQQQENYVLYTTIRGTVGVLLPLITTEDVDFFKSLQEEIARVNPPLLGKYMSLLFFVLF